MPSRERKADKRTPSKPSSAARTLSPEQPAVAGPTASTSQPDALELELSHVTEPKERIRLLNELSFRTYRRDPKRALELATEAYGLASQLADRDGTGLSLLRSAAARRELSEYKPALADIQGASTIFKELRDERKEALGYMVAGGLYEDIGNFPEAIRHYELSKSLRLKLGLKQHAANSLGSLGSVALKMGEYLKALDCFFEAKRIHEETNDLLSRSTVLCNIGSVYYEVKDPARAQDYVARSLELFTALDDLTGQASTRILLAMIAESNGKLDESHNHLQLALTLTARIGRKDFEATIYSLRGKLFLSQGELEQAEHSLARANTIVKESGLMSRQAEILCVLAEIMLHQERWKDAVKHASDALALATANGQKSLQADLCKQLAQAYKHTEKLKEAVKYYDLHIALNNELMSHEQQRAISEFQARIDIERAENEREALRVRADELQRQSDKRAKELTTVALHLVQKNEFLDELREQIRGDLQESASAKKLISRINDHIHSDRDWATFEQQFQQVHQDFLKILSERAPSLTPTELKICALMKLNLTSKAIANLFCLSLRTVENHRLSIRKKLDLPAEANLVSYLASM